MSALILIAILVVLIVVHELGHFIAAKISRVSVEEFGIGYPPRAFTLGSFRGTEYTINWLPFGGFVRLLEEDGMEMTPYRAKKAGSFAAAAKWRQAFILVAGVLMNVLAGWVFFTSGLMVGMPAAVSPETPGAKLIISGVVQGSPAYLAGLRGGDAILSIESQDARALLTPEGVSTFIGTRGGKDIAISYEREGVRGDLVVVPAHAVIPGKSAQPAIGVELAMVSHQRLGVVDALREGALNTWHSLIRITLGLFELASGAFKGTADLGALIGPVGLAGVVSDAAGQGLGQLFGLAAFISLNLAVINLLPIPALDGGRLVLVACEALLRRRVPAVLSQILNTVGFLVLIVLMVAITAQDIGRLIP